MPGADIAGHPVLQHSEYDLADALNFGEKSAEKLSQMSKNRINIGFSGIGSSP